MFSTCYGLWRFKDLAKRTASDKVLRDKAFNITKNLKLKDIKEVLLLWFTNVLVNRILVEQWNLRQIKNWLKNYINQLLKNLEKGSLFII